MIERKSYLLILTFVAVSLSGFSSLTGGSTAAQTIARSTPTPTPTASASPSTVQAKPAQTLASLQSVIAGRLMRPEVRRGRVGVKIVSLTTGKVVYEQDADKYFMPASNMKNFTVAAAMEKLGPEFRFVTSAYAGGPPDANGVIKGDLRIYGRGDVSISTAFFGTSPSDPETYYKGIDRLVDAIASTGVKRIEGSIVGDESYFKGFAIPQTWEWDDLQWYYGAEISALPINDNAVDLSVLPGAAGGPCIVNIQPANRLYQVINSCTTTSSAVKRSLGISKKIDRNVLEISGTLPVGDEGFRRPITITHPADLFVAVLRQRLEKRGIVTGSARTLPPNITDTATTVEIAKLESVPFREIAAKTMKPSQNMYTETILWTLGEQVGRKPGDTRDSYAIGLDVVKEFLTTTVGLPSDAVVQYDGCGMSRHDVVTPNAVAMLYTYMAKQSPNAQAWRDSLTIGGVDGTLAGRFKGTAAAGNIRGKTGTIDQVSALSGYMATAGGEPVVLSIIVNGVPEGRQRTSLIDDIVVAVANFDGKIEQ